MVTGDTIAAISSAVGPAARMIVRLSGPGAFTIASEICADCSAPAEGAIRTTLTIAGIPIPAWLYRFIHPHSYTGEDLIEFHIPGNPLLARMLLDELCRYGSRHAEPGEFTARAYFNGRMDLTAAEGVAATIAAHNQDELAAARQLLAGELARRVHPIMDQLAQTLALVEIGIDFSEEDVQVIGHDQIVAQIAQIDRSLAQLLQESTRFERLAHEPLIVLVGRPNAGKSTLLNSLAGQERAVVSPIQGTTRDALWAEVTLSHGIVRIVDMAGIDAESELPQVQSTNPSHQIEHQMRQRAMQTMQSADRVILVHDAADTRAVLSFDRQPDLVVFSKIDTLPPDWRSPADTIGVSALAGTHMDLLRARLDVLAFGSRASGASLALNARHLLEIQAARDALSRVESSSLSGRSELIALDLRESLDALGRIVGAISPDDVLGRIFAGFCIGK